MAKQLMTLSFVFFFHLSAFSQVENSGNSSDDEKDRNYEQEQKLIKKSTLYSAIFPGLGQVKNKKVWKIPVIYGIASGLIFSAGNSNTNYQFFRKNFLAEVDNSLTTTNVTNLNSAQLERRISFFRRNRDLSYILIGLLYFANIIDAHVDAHFKGFEVNNNLSLGIKPSFERGLAGEYKAVALVLKFNR